MALQSKWVSTSFPRMILSHLNVNAQFVFGLLLLPVYFYEETFTQEKPTPFKPIDYLMISLGSVLNLLACVALAYAFKFGLAARVQSIVTAVLLMIVVVANSLQGTKHAGWQEFAGGAGLALGAISILSYYKAKKQEDAN